MHGVLGRFDGVQMTMDLEGMMNFVGGAKIWAVEVEQQENCGVGILEVGANSPSRVENQLEVVVQNQRVLECPAEEGEEKVRWVQ